MISLILFEKKVMIHGDQIQKHILERIRCEPNSVYRFLEGPEENLDSSGVIKIKYIDSTKTKVERYR
jgi:hypothetical protein